MDDYLQTVMRRALVGGLSFRIRLDEEGAAPTLYLRLLDGAGETTWAAALSPEGDLEEALVSLFASCAQKIVEIGEREEGDFATSGRPLPAGPGGS